MACWPVFAVSGLVLKGTAVLSCGGVESYHIVHSAPAGYRSKAAYEYLSMYRTANAMYKARVLQDCL